MDTVNVVTTGNFELVLELVMSYLPIRDCVRTCILSSKWRYRWTTIPSLVFDTTCYPRSCIYTVVDEGKALSKIIDHVLLLHNGSIRVFQVRGTCGSSDVDRWIRRVSKDSIKTLVLDVWAWDTVEYELPSSLFNCRSLSSLKLKNRLLMPPPSSFKGFKNLKCLKLDCVTLAEGAFEKLISSCPLLENPVLGVLKQSYQLPPSLFACGSLSSLKLRNCLLRPPLSFKGFKNLKCLEFLCVSITNDALEKLISSCPLLEKLTLNELQEVDSMKINAPNLQDINIVSGFVSVTFAYVMTKLSVIRINVLGCTCTKLLDFFVNLPNIQLLELKSCHMGFMSGGSIVESFPFQCKDLYHLAISMDFSFQPPLYDEATLYLHRSSSRLTKQQIELGVREDNNNCHHEFKQLRRAQVNKFHDTKAELEFLKFVLGNSPVLEEMKVNPLLRYFRVGIEWEVVKSIYEFKRASKAKIIFDELVTQIC